eukprot:gene13434-15832_t
MSGPSSAANGEEEDIWGQILKESANKTNYFEAKNVIMLGDPNSGSSSLLSKFQPISDVEQLKGIALSYTFCDVFEDETSEDPIGRTNIWTLEGETAHHDLLKFALSSQNIGQSMIVITLDFSQPWNIVDSLKKWLGILEEHINAIASEKKHLLKDLQDKLLIKWHEYVEPSQPNTSNTPLSTVQKKKKRKANQTPIEDTSVLPPLGENILIKNLGVPILIVCCKSDSVVMLEKDFDYKDDLFDYIQQYLRRIALQCWDSIAKITLDFDNQKVCRDVEELYENVVKKPSIIKRREMTQTATITSEEDQEFLQKIKNNLDQDLPDQQSSKDEPESPKVVETNSPTSLRSSSSSVSSPGGSGAPPSAEKAVLANFFTSLISKDRPSQRGTGKDLKSSLTSPSTSSRASSPSVHHTTNSHKAATN